MTRTRRSWFHVGLSGAILLCVIVGFSPSFFLRPAFTDRPLPLYLYVHGAVLTLWFALGFVQSVLVASGRTAWHRKLGALGGVRAAVLVPLNASVAVRAIPRDIAAGVHLDEIQFIATCATQRSSRPVSTHTGRSEPVTPSRWLSA